MVEEAVCFVPFFLAMIIAVLVFHPLFVVCTAFKTCSKLGKEIADNILYRLLSKTATLVAAGVLVSFGTPTKRMPRRPSPP